MSIADVVFRDVVAQVTEGMPPDPTNLEDMVHVALFMGDPLKALEHAAQLDLWLSAHLADVMEPLTLVEKTANQEYAITSHGFAICIDVFTCRSDVTVREFYVLSYAHCLHSDPAMWRITVAYMYSCGKIGAATADEILVRIPLRLHSKPSDAMEDGDHTNADEGALSAIIKDINATCREYQREAVRRTICRVSGIRAGGRLCLQLGYRSRPKPSCSTRNMDLQFRITHRQKTGPALVMWLIAFCKNTLTQVGLSLSPRHSSV